MITHADPTDAELAEMRLGRILKAEAKLTKLTKLVGL